MKRLSAILTVLLVTAVSLTVQAEDWLDFIETDDGGKYYIDLDSIHHLSHDSVEVRRKFEPSKHTGGTLYHISTMKIDCRRKAFMPLSGTRKSADGKIHKLKTVSKWQDAGHDDVNDTLIELTCSLQKK